ncbi:MAG: hypothetical protein EOO63_16710 [Hymenobacter sp.]|nr:MAG: hypothetical protein EOO63_16710 [Hymenobacter sp.]
MRPSLLWCAHGERTLRDIYQFGERGTWALDAPQKYLNLHYHRLPCLYFTNWGAPRRHAAAEPCPWILPPTPSSPKAPHEGQPPPRPSYHSTRWPMEPQARTQSSD